MNLNCSKLEMIAGGGPAAARPPVPVTSPSPSQLKSARVCTLIKQGGKSGLSAGPVFREMACPEHSAFRAHMEPIISHETNSGRDNVRQEATCGHRVWTNGVLEKESVVSQCIIKCHVCTVFIVCTACSWCAWCAQCAHKKCTHKIRIVCTVCTVCTNVNRFCTPLTFVHTLSTIRHFWPKCAS
jgi:hypothetical protein